MVNVQRHLKRIDAELRGYHHGQTDLTFYAFDYDGKKLGRLEFSVYQDRPRIDYIEVLPEARRQGVGRALVNRLQRDYPGIELEWGMTTPEGTALRHAIERSEEQR